MSLYSEAAIDLRKYVEAKQAELDATAAEAHVANLAAQRAAILAWEPETSPWRSTIVLLAESITIDGDQVKYPSDTKRILRTAIAAGMDPHDVWKGTHRLCCDPDPEHMEADKTARRDADDYSDGTSTTLAAL